MNGGNGIEILTSIYPTNRESRKNIIDGIINTIDADNISLLITSEELYLVIDEALTNAMEHGNKWDSRKKVKIRLVKNSKHLHIFIEDEGKGFDIENTLITKKNVRNLKPRGRGLYIIKQFCKPSWNTTGNGIDLDFIIK